MSKSFEDELEELNREFQSPKQSQRSRERQRSMSPSGNYSANKKKPVILAVVIVLLIGWIALMMGVEKNYQANHPSTSVQMQDIRALFLDTNSDGQIDTAQLDINDDGVIDAIFQGSLTEVRQVEVGEPTPNPQPPDQ